MVKRSQSIILATLAAVCALVIFGPVASEAQQRPKITTSSLTLPVFNPLVWNIMKARGFDAKHGFELDAKPYPSISAFYAGFATGETEVLIGGPTILQKFYQEGVPLRIFGTAFTLSDLLIFAKDEKIRSLADLKGKQLAVDMGGSQFQVIKCTPTPKVSTLARISRSSTLTSRSRAPSSKLTASRRRW
jgi:NitT/TauT family transport system substrate-binding protein